MSSLVTGNPKKKQKTEAPSVNDVMGIDIISDKIINLANKRYESINFKLIKEQIVSNGTVSTKSYRYTFNVKSDFYKSLSAAKKVKLHEICNIVFKISLLKRDKYNPAYMNIVDTNEHDVINFIDDYIDDWYKYLNGEKNDISESEKGLKEQIENETPSKRYKRFFNNMDMPDFNHNVKQQDDTMTLLFTDKFVNLSRVRLTSEDIGNYGGYFTTDNYRHGYSVYNYFLNFANVIASLIIRLNNKKNRHQTISIRGAPSDPIKTSKKGNLGLTRHSWKWKWSYLFKNPEYSEEEKQIIGKISPIPGRMAEKMGKIILKF